ncbi:MAG: hypothetical protein WB973_20725 [Thermoanaerobaculia bacterium]
MKRIALAATIILAASTNVQAQTPTRQTGTADEIAVRSATRQVVTTKLSPQQEAELTQLRKPFLGAKAACSAPIALSVQGNSHHTAGQDVLLTYSTVVTNVGGAWPANSTFFAPCSGLFYFNVTFVKDAYYFGGTQDDVMVYLLRNGSSVGEAWSGEGDGARGTGAYGVALKLNQGDYVQTIVHSDGGPMRHLADYNFTGFLIR